MGYVLSKVQSIWSPADYDVPDSSTGLSRREREIVQSTWKLYRADTKKNGVKLFLKLFDQHPEYQLLFKAFSEVPRDKLPSNGRLLGHATSVMYALSSLIDNLNDLNCLVELLHKIGTSHRQRNLSAHHFQNLAQVAISCLEETLGSRVMNTRAKEAWSKTLEVANGIIIKALQADI